MFQLTPARGGRRNVINPRSSGPGFNSRPRAAGDGCDRSSKMPTSCFNSRPRAAGDHHWIIRGTSSGFNSRPRAAGDRRPKPPRIDFGFQLTPARGGRQPKSRDGQQPICGFNSRPRAAGDVNVLPSGSLTEFQLTPARGGRRLVWRACSDQLVSTHARARRATSMCSDMIPITCFNSRPRAAGDNRVLSTATCNLMFQLTPARGGRPAAGSP